MRDHERPLEEGLCTEIAERQGFLSGVISCLLSLNYCAWTKLAGH